MSITPDFIVGNLNLKSEYDKRAKMLVNQQRGRYSAAKVLGQPFKSVSGGGKNYVWAIQTSIGASFGFPAADGSVADFGNDNIAVSQIAISTSYPMARARLTIQRVLEWQAANNAGLFIDEMTEKMDGLTTSTKAIKDILFETDGTGNLATLTAVQTATIAPNATGDINVDWQQYCLQSTVFDVVRAGSVLCKVVVTSRGPDLGPGTITVKNIDASYTWVAASGDILAVGNSGGQLYTSGVREGINTGSYPRNEANNVYITDPLFNSVVKSASGAAANLDMVQRLYRLVQSRSQGLDFNQFVKYDATKPIEPSTVVCLTPAQYDSITQKLNAAQRFVNETPKPSVVYGDLVELNGMYFLKSFLNYQTDISIYHAPSWGVYDPGPQLNPTQQGLWNRISESALMEAIMWNPLIMVALNRLTQGRITDVIGIDDSSVGLT